MKLLTITPAYFPAFKYGGPIESIHLLAKSFKIMGVVEVDVLTTNAGQAKLSLDKWILVDGINVKYCKCFFYEHFTFSPTFFFSTLKTVKNYDLVYIVPIWNFTTLAGMIACILFNKPFILSPRGSLYPEAFNMRSKWIKRIYFNLIKSLINKASAIHYTCEDEKRSITSFLNLQNKSIVIPNGLDLDKFKDLPSSKQFIEKYPILKDKKYILFLSRISKKKGLDLLIPVFKKLLVDFPDFYLVIAGPDNEGYKKTVEALIKVNNIQNKVIFTGMIEEKEKASIYKNASLFILPSYSENFGMVVPEAMAFGVPVVISDKVGIKDDILEYNAGLVSKCEVDSLKDNIFRVLSSLELRKTLVINGYKLIKEKYDINVISKLMEAVFEKIINKYE